MTRLPYLLCLVVLVSGCATGPNPQDPLEPMNRKVYAFNKAVDSAAIKPAAKAYEKVVPRLARTGVSNFFRNLGMIVTTLNDALQLKCQEVPVDIMRFSANLVFGLGGVVDIATELRIPYNQEDFGQTLGYWGVNSGPYLVLPFFGPSTLRDGAALPVDLYVNPIYDDIRSRELRWGVVGLYVVDTRTNLLGTERFLHQASLDEYGFLRDTWLQRREYLVRDGAIQAQSDSVPSADRPKSLLELEEEDFGDEPMMDNHEPAN